MKSNVILVGVSNVLLGFDLSGSIMRVVEYYDSEAFPPMLFYTKDLKPLRDNISLASAVFVENNQIVLELPPMMVTEWGTSESGELEAIYPSMDIVTNEHTLLNIYNKYIRILEIKANRTISEAYENIEDSDIFTNFKNIKAANRPIVWNIGFHSLMLFYGIVNLNKGDTLSVNFYDIDNIQFMTEFISYKKKNKTYVTTYTINFTMTA